jgi:hypothetical protein
VTRQDLADELREDARFLDVCRLFLGTGQEPAAHMLSDAIEGPRMSWNKLRAVAHQSPEVIAAALPRRKPSRLGGQWILLLPTVRRHLP